MAKHLQQLKWSQREERSRLVWILGTGYATRWRGIDLHLLEKGVVKLEPQTLISK